MDQKGEPLNTHEQIKGSPNGRLSPSNNTAPSDAYPPKHVHASQKNKTKPKTNPVHRGEKTARGRGRGRGRRGNDFRIEYVAKDSPQNKTHPDQAPKPKPKKSPARNKTGNRSGPPDTPHRSRRGRIPDYPQVEYKLKSSQQYKSQVSQHNGVSDTGKNKRQIKPQPLKQQKKEEAKKKNTNSSDENEAKEVKGNNMYADLVREGKDENLYYSTTSGMVVVSDQPGIKYDDDIQDEWNHIKTKQERVLERGKEKQKQKQKEKQIQNKPLKHSLKSTASANQSSPTGLEKENRLSHAHSLKTATEELDLSPDAPQVDVSELQLPNVKNLSIKFGSWEGEEGGDNEQDREDNASTQESNSSSSRIIEPEEEEKEEDRIPNKNVEHIPQPENVPVSNGSIELKEDTQSNQETVKLRPPNVEEMSFQPISEPPIQYGNAMSVPENPQGWEYPPEMAMEGIPPGHPAMQGMPPMMDEYQMTQQFPGDANAPMPMVYGQPWQTLSGAPMQPSSFSYSHNMYPSSPYMFVPPWYMPSESPPSNYPPYPYMHVPEEQEFQFQYQPQHHQQRISRHRGHHKRNRNNNPNQGFYHQSGPNPRPHHNRARGRGRRSYKRDRNNNDKSVPST